MLVQRVTRLPAQKGAFSFAKENTPFTPCSAVGLHFPLYLCEKKSRLSQERQLFFLHICRKRAAMRAAASSVDIVPVSR